MKTISNYRTIKLICIKFFYLKLKKQIKLEVIAFDLDGVLINSIPNMQEAWKNTCTKNNFNIPFSKYKKLIGLPFVEILKKLKIKRNFKNIQKDYRFFSSKHINLIKIYPNIRNILKKLKQKYKIVIITSKERKRAVNVLKKKKLDYDMLVTPNDVKKGKPNNDSTRKVLKELSLKRDNMVYIGDTIFDYQFAKNSKINFFFADWGYGCLKINKSKKIYRPKDILNLF